jgi:putative intracellular protease/amidase
LRLTPDAVLADAPPLDVLHVPGGYGQEALMDDAETLAWIRQQASGGRSIFSVCTGALHLRRGRSPQGTPGDDPLVGVAPIAVLRGDPYQ